MTYYVKMISTLSILTVVNIVFCGYSHATDNLRSGSQYKVIKPVYIMATYNSLNNRKISKDTAIAYLHSTKYYKKSYVAFQYEVPAGTTITIIGPASKLWYLPFSAVQYFVTLAPDLSGGLDVVLKLNRGMEGTLDRLNPELFSKL